MKKYNTKVKLVAGILFVAVYVALFVGLWTDIFDSTFRMFMAPIIVLYTLLMFGIGIVVLWKQKKTLWCRVMIGYGFYMIISIVNAVEAFTNAESVSRMLYGTSLIFIVALLLSLLVYVVKRAGSLREKWLNVSGFGLRHALDCISGSFCIATRS